jgi:integrase
MAIVKDLDQHYVDTQLVCPSGKSQIEIVDPLRTGLYIEVRAVASHQGTYYLRCKDHSGKTARRRVGRTTEVTLEEARAAAVKLRADIRGTTATPSQTPPARAIPAVVASKLDRGLTLDAFMTEFYFPHVKVHKRSWKRDEQLYRLRIKDKFGGLALAQISRREVNQFKIALLGQGLANASVNHHVQLLRHICNLAVSWELLDRNALVGIELLDLDNQVENYLDDETVDRFVEVSTTDANHGVCMVLMFLLSTGCRLGEALTAQWSQVDLDKRIWKILATNSKSKKPKYLPLNDSAMWVIEQLKSKGSSTYLFPSPATGRPYTTITRAWYRIRKKAGIADNVRIHDLRHTFASRLVSRQIGLFEAQKLLGHADPRTTMRYAHLSMAAMKEASNVAAFAVA